MIEETLRRHALEKGDKPAVICGERSLTYGQLDSLSNKLADSLSSLGLAKKSKVSFLLNNSLEFPLIYYTLIKLGAIAVPINTRYQASELQFVLNHVESELLLFNETYQGIVRQIRPELSQIKRYIMCGDRGESAFSKLLEKGKDVRRSAPVSDVEEMIYFYTSGTTGDPKGVVLTRANCISSAKMWIEAMGFSSRDKMLVTTPLWHCSATTAFMLSAGIVGATLILLPEFSTEEVLRMIQIQKPNFIWLVPSIMILLQQHPRVLQYDLTSLKTILSGGSPVDTEVVKWWKDTVQHIEVCNGYAQTEGATACSLLRDEHILSKPHSIGTAISRVVQLKVVDEKGDEAESGKTGEIVMRGPNVMKGYYKNHALTEKTIRERWLFTGDLGHFDREGFLYFDGRKRDLIIRGGENIFPEEIETVLSEHPDVLENAVIGVHDEILGEVVMAVVVRKRESRVLAKDLISYCSGFLADYKVPKFVTFVEELPKNPTGKVLKKVLRKEFGAEGSQ
ncbi:MAG: acyl--CoA ligase [Candidatus Aminicenantes bacterium]|nr:acyl--CoA ligase [Candidatus Aminicenantes bacterium]